MYLLQAKNIKRCAWPYFHEITAVESECSSNCLTKVLLKFPSYSGRDLLFY